MPFSKISGSIQPALAAEIKKLYSDDHKVVSDALRNLAAQGKSAESAIPVLVSMLHLEEKVVDNQAHTLRNKIWVYPDSDHGALAAKAIATMGASGKSALRKVLFTGPSEGERNVAAAHYPWEEEGGAEVLQELIRRFDGRHKFWQSSMLKRYGVLNDPKRSDFLVELTDADRPTEVLNIYHALQPSEQRVVIEAVLRKARSTKAIAVIVQKRADGATLDSVSDLLKQPGPRTDAVLCLLQSVQDRRLVALAYRSMADATRERIMLVGTNIRYQAPADVRTFCNNALKQKEDAYHLAVMHHLSRFRSAKSVPPDVVEIATQAQKSHVLSLKSSASSLLKLWKQTGRLSSGPQGNGPAGILQSTIARANQGGLRTHQDYHRIAMSEDPKVEAWLFEHAKANQNAMRALTLYARESHFPKLSALLKAQLSNPTPEIQLSHLVTGIAKPKTQAGRGLISKLMSHSSAAYPTTDPKVLANASAIAEGLALSNDLYYLPRLASWYSAAKNKKGAADHRFHTTVTNSIRHLTRLQQIPSEKLLAEAKKKYDSWKAEQ